MNRLDLEPLDDELAFVAPNPYDYLRVAGPEGRHRLTLHLVRLTP